MAVAPKIFNGDNPVNDNLRLEDFKVERAQGAKSGNTSIVTIVLSSPADLAEWGGLNFLYSEAMVYAGEIMATDLAILRSFQCKHLHKGDTARGALYSEDTELVITIAYLSSFWEQ